MRGKKSAVEGGVEIVRSVTPEEWKEIIIGCTQTVAEMSAAIAEFADALGRSMDDIRESVAEFSERWSKIDFS